MCYYTYSVHLHQEKIRNKSNKKMVKGMLTLVCNSTAPSIGGTWSWWSFLPALGPGTARAQSVDGAPAPALLHAHVPAGSAADTVKLVMFIMFLLF